MTRTVAIGNKNVGEGQPTYIIAEIGINHNGDVGVAKQLIDVAADAGCDAVKFQKRNPDVCVPEHQKNVMRETPWGVMTYLDYKYRVEFGADEYHQIARHCEAKGIAWFASCWDESSIDFMEQFDPPCYKVASASLTDHTLLKKLMGTGRPIIQSTGMSTQDEIDAALKLLDSETLLVAHSTSTYPCPNEELNLRMIQTLKSQYPYPIGYSGHERGLQTTVAAVTLGATFIERHITLDRAMWGTDHAASIEPQGLNRLVRDIRVVEAAMGDGVKRVYESELPVRKKLRGV